MSRATPTKTCRSCGEARLVPVCDLGDQPLANALPATPNAPVPRYPLVVAACSTCGLAQLTVSVDPAALFSDYPYLSSYSPAVVASAEQLARRLTAERGLDARDLVIDVASNDGYLLRHYAMAGIPVLGIDPAANIAPVAEAAGVRTVVDFFDLPTARRLGAEGHRASILHANNVLAHVPHPNDFVAAVAELLRDDGLAVVEVPYLRELVDRLEYDTIYHEHLCYFSLSALEALLTRNGLALVDVERIPLHGGSLRVFATAGPARQSAAVIDLLAQERGSDLGVASLQRFAHRVQRLRRRQREVLQQLVAGGATVAGYGAAAKATVTLNATALGAETVAFVVDRSPHKHGRYVAGTDVPILPLDALRARAPDYLVIFAWNYADEIMEQCADFRRGGGRFVIPVPDVRIM